MPSAFESFSQTTREERIELLEKVIQGGGNIVDPIGHPYIAPDSHYFRPIEITIADGEVVEQMVFRVRLSARIARAVGHDAGNLTLGTIQCHRSGDTRSAGEPADGDGL